MIRVMYPFGCPKPSWSYQRTVDSSLDEVSFHGLDIDSELRNSKLYPIFLSSTEDFSGISSSIPYFIDSCDKLQTYPVGTKIHLNPSSENPSLLDEVEDYFDWMEYEERSPSREQSLDGTSTSVMTSDSPLDFCSPEKTSLVFPKEDTDLEDQLSILHLLKALGEAIHSRCDDLVNVIVRRLEEKACPKGTVLHRLAYYLIQSFNSNLDYDYLVQEAIKNYDAASSLFYQIFPYGRLVHFVANSSILEALSEDVKTIHLVDFDIGQGVQWPPLIEAIIEKHQQIVIRLISLKCEDKDDLSTLQIFDSTKHWLCEQANAYSPNLQLQVEEITMENLASELKKLGKDSGKENWVAFNCMTGLPHMARHRSSRHVTEFIKVAQDYIGQFSSRGILTFGSGSYLEEGINIYHGSSSSFEAELTRITALFDLMELQMPSHLREARVAMECLFLAPHLCSLSFIEKSGERELICGVVPKIGLGKRKMSKFVIAEAKELVRVVDSSLSIRTEGKNENQVVLCFKGTPLVRISSWS